MRTIIKIFIFTLLFTSLSYSYSHNQIKVIQTELSDLGFDPGIIDGKMGPNTANAIKDFQKSIGERPSGKLNRHTYYKIHNAANSVTAGFSHEAEELNGIKRPE